MISFHKLVIVFLFSYFLFSFSPVFPQSKIISLNEGWKFRRVGDTLWYPATVPGTVHTDLLTNGLIPDPFFGDNEKRLQWIENETWEYSLDFDLDTKTAADKSAIISFDGLDTYADVYINGQKMEKHWWQPDNMFVYKKFRNQDYKTLKENGNNIHIIFYPAQKTSDSIANAYYRKYGSKELPGGSQIFTRKAPYNFGWDWGPRFVTSGIWKEAYVETGADNKIEDIRTSIEKLTTTKAVLTFYMTYMLTPEKNSGCTLTVTNTNDGKTLYTGGIDFLGQDYPGVKILQNSVQVEIDNPKPWWCNGMGEPYLYSFKFTVKKDNATIDEKTVKTGLREIDHIKEKDGQSESFYFKLNGKPVFIKGANYIPPDVFLPRFSKEQYRELLVNAKNSNMNMLRVWGGGAYADDYFYDLCDSLGIMVWQDFMFACAMYPGNEPFVNSVKQEVKNNFQRLKNHPCIALWCGNNEIDEGWKNWGWQKQFGYTEQEQNKIWADYVRIFEKEIPSALKENIIEISGDIAVDPIESYTNKNYIPTSPKIGWGHPEAMTHGDSHYWGVWWGMEPFETYEMKVPRFMSEYGFQSFPDAKSIRKFLKEEDMYLYSDALKVHQKHPVGFETIQKYMEREYKQPKDFESYVYVSQLLQAYGIKRAIEAQRRAKPYCMGTLYWQLNDCWPVVSWSGIDYYGSVKPLQHFVRDAYRDMLISFEKKESNIGVYVVNDRPGGAEGVLQLKLLDFSGNVLWQNSQVIKIKENSSEKFLEFKIDTLTGKHNPKEILLTATLNVINEKSEYTNTYFFADPKDLQLKDPGYGYALDEQERYLVLKLWCTSFAKDVKVDYGEEKTLLNAKNYFNMLPGDTTYVVLGKDAVKNNTFNLRITSLYDTYNK